METILGKHWHRLPAQQVLDFLGTDPDKGLDTFEAAHRQERFGANVLTSRSQQGSLVRFLLQFHQPLVYILLAAASITATLQEWVDSAVILGVVLVNALIGFVQESKAVKAMEALARSMHSEATVIRAGQKKKVSSAELVPGDVVLLQSGDKVPADLRLLRSRELQIDESALTGESVPVGKQPEALAPDAVLADRSNMGYSSTLVTYGTGAGAVVATGDGTEVGRINELIAAVDVLATPLTRKIAHFSGMLLWVILGLAGVTLVVGMLRGETLFDMFMAAVALAVGAIPEGLPAAMTITLAIGVARMAKRHAIIRKLPAVETLGSTTVICSDKTGTLTQNQMTVQEVLAGGESFAVSGVGYVPEGEFSKSGVTIDPKAHPTLFECLTAGLLCNDARLISAEGGWCVEGDPTEGALLTSASKAGLSPDTLTRDLPRLDTIPFESQRQYMATLHDAGPNRPRLLYLKGSVERIVARCRDAANPNMQPVDLAIDAIHSQVDEMAAKGMRVLAFARAEMPADHGSVTHRNVAGELTFLGLQAMIDPPRPEAVNAVHICQAAGIRIKMITGDHVGTASAIARQIGLDGARDADGRGVAMSGQAIEELSDADLIETAERVAVFARVAPEQKLRLVEALQARDHVVAMTGDGVNDAPALRQANIGVAMGVAGTEVAKEAADMVLTDDNFSTVEAAVEEGRGVFDNLVKFITWTLPTNIGEGLVILVAVFAGLTLPILPVQILWINMTTAVLLGLVLAFEPKEPGIMNRPPRDPQSPILTRPLVVRILLVGLLLLVGSFGLFEWELSHGESDAAARTAAVNVFVFGELFYLFNCRSLTHSMFRLGVFSNRWLLVGVSAMVVLQLLFTYLPTMQRAFRSAPLGLTEWWLIITVGFVIYGVVGIEKWFRGRREDRHEGPDLRWEPGAG
ncbi:MAG: cation-transporting P-type ATPase [Acidiferrobacterales bacterium]